MRYYCPDGRLTAAYRSAGKYTSPLVNDITHDLCVIIVRMLDSQLPIGQLVSISPLVNDITYGLCVTIVRMLD